MVHHANPLLQDWKAPHGLPPFNDIRPAHFAPAFEQSMRDHLAEIEAIAGQPAAPDFQNTVAAFDASGRLLSRIEMVFSSLNASHTNPELQ